MIRINLIAGPRAKKTPPAQWGTRAEALAGVAVVGLTLLIAWLYVGMLQEERQAKEQEKQEKEKQIVALKEQVKQVDGFEQKKKTLEDKNRIIDQLEKSRSGPVKVMDHLSRSLDPLKLWLLKMSMKEGRVEVEGRALTNDDIVEFVNNLRRTEYFTAIQLMESRAATEGKAGVFSFKITFSLRT